ncbi:MAG: hypothetical protein Q9205_004118 [Flavoplaca limonia]
MAEQLDFAFEIFDPIESSPEHVYIPKLDDLPLILEKSNRLARVDRYLSSLEEIVAFFTSVRQELSLESTRPWNAPAVPCLTRDVILSANLEVSRAQRKIEHERRLCKTYLRQFDTLVQLVSLEKLSKRPATPANAS